MQDRLYHNREIAQFYDLENGWGPDHAYCARLAQRALSVLDLGCGTGRFLAQVADGRDAVGVDPAAAMLEIARSRAGGDGVSWVEGDMRTVRLGRRFDLVILTGHAFQVLLNDDDRKRALETIAAHIEPGGRFVFDTRNPSRAEWREWTPDVSRRSLDHPQLGVVEAWNDVSQEPTTGIVAYETHYRIVAADRHLSAVSRIAFVEYEDIARLIHSAGLAADTWLGDWSGTAFTRSSPEIIPVGRLRR